MFTNYLRVFIRDGFKFLWRNRGISLASIMTVSVSLIILGFTLIVVNSGTQVIAHMQTQVEINTYLKEDVSRADALKLGKEIEKLPGFEELEFVSKEKGLLLLQEKIGTEMDLNDTLGGDNPLPDYYIVKAKTPEMVDVVAAELRKMDEVDNLIYGKEMVDKLLALTIWAKNIGIFVITGVILASLFLIMTTIRLTVYARSHEIKVMKYVGATNLFVVAPFFIEGMVIGLLGSLVASVSLYFGYARLIDYIAINIPFIPIEYDYYRLYIILACLAVVGLSLGTIGSFSATRKYLKV